MNFTFICSITGKEVSGTWEECVPQILLWDYEHDNKTSFGPKDPDDAYARTLLDILYLEDFHGEITSTIVAAM